MESPIQLRAAIQARRKWWRVVLTLKIRTYYIPRCKREQTLSITNHQRKLIRIPLAPVHYNWNFFVRLQSKMTTIDCSLFFNSWRNSCKRK